ncbi:fumarase [Aureococcus anophagefferens]|nr:fumarase [Aureococcus anophagefferens]
MQSARRPFAPHAKKLSAVPKPGPPPFVYRDLFEQTEPVDVPYRKLEGSEAWVSEVAGPWAGATAPPQLASILGDPDASSSDRFVALELLKNANVAAGMVLPGCQDTGTGIVMGKRGALVLTDGDDAARLARGVYETYVERNLRYSQVAPMDISTSTPPGDEYHFLFVAKGGGSANKTFLFQQTKALLNEASLLAFVEEKIKGLGTAACPPYHLALVVGGLSAEMTLKTVKLASTKYLDGLPRSGDANGRAFRDEAWEAKVLQLTRPRRPARFGGKYFCHDVRVVRLPRHGASCPVGLGVSCSADRQVRGKVTRDGVFLEALGGTPRVPAGRPSTATAASARRSSPSTSSGPWTTSARSSRSTRRGGSRSRARSSSRHRHPKIQERLDAGEPMPQYLRDRIVYYAGPAKTPDGHASGSRPATAGAWTLVGPFMEAGGSFVSWPRATGRSRSRTPASATAASTSGASGAAAILAQNCIRSVEVLEYRSWAWSAVWKIDVENFAFIVVNDKGDDFFKRLG